jgi:hypothetical protein
MPEKIELKDLVTVGVAVVVIGTVLSYCGTRAAIAGTVAEGERQVKRAVSREAVASATA